MEIDEVQEAVIKTEEAVAERSLSVVEETPTRPSPSPKPPSHAVEKSSTPSPLTAPEQQVERAQSENEQRQSQSPERTAASRAPSTAAPDSAREPALGTDLSRMDNASEDSLMSILHTPSQAEPLPIARVESQTKYVIAEQPSPAPPPPEFAFDVEMPSAEQAEEQNSTVQPSQTLFKTPTYSLPPLKSLPAEFNRRGKVKQSKKREKDRADGKSQEWQPLGMARWSAMLRANPIHKKVAKATKCLSTHDWNASDTTLFFFGSCRRDY